MKFTAHFMYRNPMTRSLDNAEESGDAKTKKAARDWAKAIAKERDWRLLDVRFNETK